MAEGAGNADPLTNEQPVYEVDIPVTALLKFAVVVVVTVLLLAALSRAQQLVGVGIAAAILSALLAPAVRFVAKGIGRVTATVVLHLVVLVAIAASTALVVGSIRSESEALATYTESQLDELDANGGPTFLTRTRLDERVGDAVESWGVAAVVGEDDAGGIASRVSELVLLIVFSAFLSLQGDALLSMALGWTEDRDRRRVLREIWREGVDRAAAFTRRAMAVSVVSGAIASGVAVAFDLPGALLIGVAAGLLSAIPLLGALAGWSPIILIAVVDRTPGDAAAIIVAAAAGIVFTGWLRHRVFASGFSPGTLLVALGIAAGLSAAGLPGAIAGMFLSVAAASAASHDWTVERLTSIPPARTPTQGSSLVRTALRTSATATVAGGEDEEADDRLLLSTTRGTLLRVTAIVVAAFALQLSLTRIGPTVIWATVGVLIAIGLDRPVSWLGRRAGFPRSATVVVGAFLIAVAVVGLFVTASGSFGESANIDTDVSEVVTSLEELPLVGDRLASLDLETRVEQIQREVPQLMSSSSTSDRAFALLGGGVVGAFWILVVAMTCLLDGPRLVAAIDRRVPARFRRQSIRLARSAHGALSGYVAGSALVAALNGFIVGTLGFVVGVPAPAVLAIWAFGWNFVPQIGAVVGWAPFLLLAFLVGPIQGVACIVFFIAYQLVENNLIQPSIVGAAVDITPLAALTAALVGVTVAGLVGAVLAIPTAGVIRAMVDEWRRDDFPAVRPDLAADAAS